MKEVIDLTSEEEINDKKEIISKKQYKFKKILTEEEEFKIVIRKINIIKDKLFSCGISLDNLIMKYNDRNDPIYIMDSFFRLLYGNNKFFVQIKHKNYSINYKSSDLLLINFKELVKEKFPNNLSIQNIYNTLEEKKVVKLVVTLDTLHKDHNVLLKIKRKNELFVWKSEIVPKNLKSL
jgi:hypothetical protein